MKKATNNLSMKQDNRRVVLDCIRRAPISRAEIAQRVQLTRASVTIITEELINEGLIYEAEMVHSSRGRSPVLLMLNPDSKRFGGVNIKREHIEVGITNIAGETLMQQVLPYDGATPETLLKKVCDLLKPYLPELEGIGVCAPGPLDYLRGRLLNPPNFEAWHGLPVLELIACQLDKPLRLENVSNALALEEKYFGTIKDIPNFALLLVDSGIGLGIMLNDSLLRGANGLGVELGHTTVEINGLPCACGNVGCLEKYASMPALLESSPFGSWQMLVDRLDSSPQAQALLEREVKYLSVSLINMINLLDIDRVILKGDITYNAGRLCKLLNRSVVSRVIARRNRDENMVYASESLCSARTAAMPAIHAFFH